MRQVDRPVWIHRLAGYWCPYANEPGRKNKPPARRVPAWNPIPFRNLDDTDDFITLCDISDIFPEPDRPNIPRIFRPAPIPFRNRTFSL